MKTNDFLHCFGECISDRYAVKENIKKLAAIDEGIDVKIKSQGQYLLYEFDKSQEKKRDELFPFFGNVRNLKAIADYVLLTVHKEKIYAIVIELKQGKGNHSNQIQATKDFVEFLVKGIDRVKKSGYGERLELRGIKYSKSRDDTKVSPRVDYDNFKNTFLTGNCLYLNDYLQ